MIEVTKELYTMNNFTEAARQKVEIKERTVGEAG